MKKVFAFVFARGGSQGLPRKNILKIGNKPLVSHSIEIAQQIEEIERIFVSTDDDEIKQIAIASGAEIIDRPRKLAAHQASEIEAWKHAIRHLQDKGEVFDVFLSLPATSPLRNKTDIRNCLRKLENENEIVITVTPSSRSPHFNMVTLTDDNTCDLIISSDRYVRRQDVPVVYDITTVAYAMHQKLVLEINSIFDGKVKAVEIPKERAVDIDDLYDFKLAEVLYKLNESAC